MWLRTRDRLWYVVIQADRGRYLAGKLNTEPRPRPTAPGTTSSSSRGLGACPCKVEWGRAKGHRSFAPTPANAHAPPTSLLPGTLGALSGTTAMKAASRVTTTSTLPREAARALSPATSPTGLTLTSTRLRFTTFDSLLPCGWDFHITRRCQELKFNFD